MAKDNEITATEGHPMKTDDAMNDKREALEALTNFMRWNWSFYRDESQDGKTTISRDAAFYAAEFKRKAHVIIRLLTPPPVTPDATCEDFSQVQTPQPEPDSPDASGLPDVIKFLLGEGALDGVWYGEKPDGKPSFWWRAYLREYTRTPSSLAELEAELTCANESIAEIRSDLDAVGIGAAFAIDLGRLAKERIEALQAKLDKRTKALEDANYKLLMIDPVCYQGCKPEIREVSALLREALTDKEESGNG